MLWKIWATVGAIVCGVAVATLPGGTASPWAYVVLLGGACRSRIDSDRTSLGYARNRQLERSEILPMEPVFKPTDRQAHHDEEVVEQPPRNFPGAGSRLAPRRAFHGALARRPCDRASGALDLRCGSARDIDPELMAAVAMLTDAVRTFISVYDESTSPDPLVRDSIWRMVDEADNTGTTTSLREKAAESSRRIRNSWPPRKRKFATPIPGRQQRRER